MSEQTEPKEPSRISFTGARGTFKLSVNENSETTATPLRYGKLMTSPSHAHSNVSNKWAKLQSLPQTMSEKTNEINLEETDTRNIDGHKRHS